MRMLCYTGGPVACNAYLLLPEGTGKAVLIDAPEGVADWVAAQLPADMRLAQLLLTHQHFDHVQDAAAVQARFGCCISAFCPPDDELTLAAAAAAWGLPPTPPYTVDAPVGSAAAGDWGGMAWQVFSIPGHSRDGLAYYLPAEGVVFVGDILFAGAVGRTDFPGGSMRTLTEGIRRHLLSLPPATRVCCGHGPATTIGEELLTNPYLS